MGKSFLWRQKTRVVKAILTGYKGVHPERELGSYRDCGTGSWMEQKEGSSETGQEVGSAIFGTATL